MFLENLINAFDIGIDKTRIGGSRPFILLNNLESCLIINVISFHKLKYGMFYKFYFYDNIVVM